MKFNELKNNELDIVITGLRLVRRGAYDSYTRNVASDLLDQALRRKQDMNHKPEWEGEAA